MKSSKSLKKWFMVSLFGLSAATSQALWLNFGPLLSLIEKKFSVTEDQAGLLLLVFPLIYVLISIPSGRFIDKKGYRKSLLIGGFVMAVFSSIRIFAFSFWILLIAQAGIAVAQPFIINSISKLVLDWFPKNEEAVATGVGTGGMFIGMAAGLMATPYFVEKVGFENTMILFALISVLSLALSYFFIHPPNTEYKIMSPIEDSKQIETISLRSILKDRNLALIFLVSFLGLGFFNGLTTWLEPILAPRGIDSLQAGLVGGMLIIGGIAGSAVVPSLSDFWKRRKPFLLGCAMIATILIYPLCFAPNFHRAFIVSSVEGFFFLPAFALILQMCAEYVGEARAGIATSILMLVGNAGGVAVIIAMEALKSTRSGFTPAVHFMFALLVLTVVSSYFIKETHP